MSSENNTPYISLGNSPNVFSGLGRKGGMQPIERRRYPIGTCAHSNKWGTDYVVIGEHVNEYGSQECVQISRDEGEELLIIGYSKIQEPEDEYGICIIREDKTLSSTEVAALVARAREQIEARSSAKGIADRLRDDAIERGRKFAALLIPASTTGLIIARLERDDSDCQTDYWGSSTLKSHILAVSPHRKALFPEMRKGAARFEGTAHLAEDNKAQEHRENYSGGGGNYLKAGYRHSNGWTISKGWYDHDKPDTGTLYLLGMGLHSLELPSASPAILPPTEGVTVRENEDKDGFEVVFAAKPSRQVLDLLKSHGFRWSGSQGLWYAKRTDERRTFLSSLA